MPEGPWESDVAPMHRMTRRDRQAWRQALDRVYVDVARRGDALGGRLGWWRERRRLRRRYGIVASRIGASTWELRVEDA